jgi:hypothetical protein
MPAPAALPGLTATPVPAVTPAPAFDDHAALVSGARALWNCEPEDKLSTEWQKRNDIVVGYVRSLGSLANLDAVPTFSGLGSALMQNGVVSETQDKAFQNLLNAIALSATRAGQEDAIARASVATKEPLRDAVSALKSVDSYYANVLDAEYHATFSTYTQLICDELLVAGQASDGSSVGRCFVPPTFPTTIRASSRERLRQETQQLLGAVQAINARRQATIGYADALDAIVATNDELATKASGKLSLSDVVAICKKHLIDLATAVADVTKAVQ